MIGYLELLSGPVSMDQDMQKKYIDITYTKAKRLQKLIEDLFGFTNVKAKTQWQKFQFQSAHII